MCAKCPARDERALLANLARLERAATRRAKGGAGMPCA